MMLGEPGDMKVVFYSFMYKSSTNVVVEIKQIHINAKWVFFFFFLAFIPFDKNSKMATTLVFVKN